MNAIIVDDEQANQENLHHLLQQYAADVQVCAMAGNVEDALNAISRHRPQIVFLDIQLQNQSGFDLLKRLGQVNFEVIFVTAFNQYGIEAVKFAALDYLLKPIDITELILAVNKARLAIQKRQSNERLQYLADYLKGEPTAIKRIALPMFTETRYVNMADIVRLQADNTYTNFYLADGETLLVSKTIKEYVDLLSRYHFIRTHQSHLVNINYVKSWLKEDGGSLLLKNGTKIPISKPNREKVKDAL